MAEGEWGEHDTELSDGWWEYVDTSDSPEWVGRALEDDVEDIRLPRWRLRGPVAHGIQRSFESLEAAVEDMHVHNPYCGDIPAEWIDEDGLAEAQAAFQLNQAQVVDLAEALAEREVLMASVTIVDRSMDRVNCQPEPAATAGTPGQVIAMSPMQPTGPPSRTAAPSSEAQPELLAAFSSA